MTEHEMKVKGSNKTYILVTANALEDGDFSVLVADKDTGQLSAWRHTEVSIAVKGNRK